MGIIVRDAGEALVIVDHRMQRARLMVGRAIQRQHVRPARLQHVRAARSGCATCRHLPRPRSAPLALRRRRRVPNNASAGQVRGRARPSGSTPGNAARRTGSRPCSRHAPATRRQARRSPSDEACRRLAQSNSPSVRRWVPALITMPFGRRLGLQPRREIRRLADDIDLRGLALADRLADQHLPGSDPDAHAKHDVADAGAGAGRRARFSRAARTARSASSSCACG